MVDEMENKYHCSKDPKDGRSGQHTSFGDNFVVTLALFDGHEPISIH